MENYEANFNKKRLSELLIKARQLAGMHQPTLANRCGFSQQQISGIESGTKRPTFEQILKIAQALDLPIQYFLSGRVGPGRSLREMAVELRHWGIVDLWVEDALVPGAFRRLEEIVNLILAEVSPDPRILEAIPALLAWNELDYHLLSAHASILATSRRLGWLASITVSISRQNPFPGGCHRVPLERYLSLVNPPDPQTAWDDLGKNSDKTPSLPIWKRWRISYDAKPSHFLERAENLFQLKRRPESKSANNFQGAEGLLTNNRIKFNSIESRQRDLNPEEEM